MQYNREAVLLLVNRSYKLTEKYLKLIEKGTKIEQALRTMFYDHISDDPVLCAEYQLWLPRNEKVTLPAELHREIFKLIEKHSWPTFRLALMDVAKYYAYINAEVGLTHLEKQWHTIQDRVGSITTDVTC